MEAQNQEVTQEDISQILEKSLKTFFNENNQYKKDKATQCCQAIIDLALKELIKLKKMYKYTITCILMQKNGAGIVTAGKFYGETTKDGYFSVQSECGTFQAILTAFFIAI